MNEEIATILCLRSIYERPFFLPLLPTFSAPKEKLLKLSGLDAPPPFLIRTYLHRQVKRRGGIQTATPMKDKPLSSPSKMGEKEGQRDKSPNAKKIPTSDSFTPPCSDPKRKKPQGHSQICRPKPNEATKKEQRHRG